jgi:hypothetical protein
LSQEQGPASIRPHISALWKVPAKREVAMTRTLVGLFDSRGDAERVVEHLVQELKVDPAGIEVHGAGDPATRSLRGLLLPARDQATYSEGIRRGGVVVAAHVPESRADRAMDIFEEYHAVDLDAREVDWRGAGWAAEPNQGGYTGHDEDIGFATYGGDAVVRRIPRHHHDDVPAGLLGRLEMASMRRVDARPRVRSYAMSSASNPEKA